MMKCGEENFKNKLTSGEVIEIYEAVWGGEVQAVVARRYNVTQGCVCHIMTGRTWISVIDKHVNS